MAWPRVIVVQPKHPWDESRDIIVNDLPRGKVDNEEEIDGSEEQADHGQKVTRPHVFGMILEKNRPSFTWRTGRTRQAQILPNGRYGDLNVQFEQFSTDGFCAPEHGFLGHMLNQANCFRS